MEIREATPADNDELQALQARCPMGTSLIVTNVNTPDFFGRAKAYESFKVYVACEGDEIIGSGACALREGLVGGELRRVGYLFQAFVSPRSRRRGVASRLLQKREAHLAGHGAVLAYTLILEGNLPSMRYVESRGYQLQRTLLMPGLAIIEEVEVPPNGAIRPVTSEDFAAVAGLLNQTWAGSELHEPATADGLARYIERVPAYSKDNLLVLEDRGEIVACLGYWDWSKVMRITVEALSPRLRMMGLMLKVAGILRPMPAMPGPGTTLKQIMLTPIGFRDPERLASLLRHVNNLALSNGIEVMYCVCEPDNVLLRSMEGFFRIDTSVHLYVKPLARRARLDDRPVFIDGVDL